MKVYLLHSDLRVQPGDPVELVVAVDGKTLRVAVEWAAVEYFLGPGRVSVSALHEFVHRNRHEIELAIKAYLFAYGMPLGGQIVMSRNDLDWRSRMPRERAAGGDAAARA